MGLLLAMTCGEVVPRRKEIRSKVCVVAKVHIISIETWPRRMENGLKVCVVAFVKRGRYDYETMHVHHVIAKPVRAVAIFVNGLGCRLVLQIATSFHSSQ